MQKKKNMLFYKQDKKFGPVAYNKADQEHKCTYDNICKMY